MHFAEVGGWGILVREGTWPMKLILGLAGAGTVAAIGSDVKDFAGSDIVYTYSYPLYGTGSATSLVGIRRIVDSIGVEQGGSSSS
jgi:NADPH:quinone reductase-like Zn-dependent oxidoreductase